jgi:glycosyltransferase involved in cell wall biosynthesis
VFYGLYTPLQGTPTIGAALGKLAAASTPIEVTMIGRGQDEAETKSAAAANQSVHWRDWVPATELPQVVASHDVCLGIFGTGEKARRVVPNKVFQGAAAGCAIVTSDTAPQRRVFGDAAVLVPPGDADALATGLLELASDRDRLAELRAAARGLAEKRYSPAQVVAPLIEKIVRLRARHAPASLLKRVGQGRQQVDDPCRAIDHQVGGLGHLLGLGTRAGYRAAGNPVRAQRSHGGERREVA